MSNKHRIVVGLASLCLAVWAGVTTAGCSKSADDGTGGSVTDDGGVGEGGQIAWGGSESTDGTTVTPDQCDANAVDDPDAEFVDSNCDGIDGSEKDSIFVSPLGDDAFVGTMDKPVATIGKGIELALAQDKVVLVCTTTYQENLVVTGSESALRVYGAYACLDGWGRTKGNTTVAPVSGVPLSISDVTTEVVFSQFEFVAPNATLPGESSIAARVVGSKEVAFDHVDLVAGDGKKGLSGALATGFTQVAEAGRAGANAPSYASTDLAGCYKEDTACLDKCEAACTGPICLCNTLCPKIFINSTSCKAELTKRKTIPQPWKCPAGEDCVTLCETDKGPMPVKFQLGGVGGNGFLDKPPGNGVVPKTDYAGTVGAFGTPSMATFGQLGLDGVYLPSNAGDNGGYGDVGKEAAGGKGYIGERMRGDIEIVYFIGGAGGSSGKAGCGGAPGNGGGGGGGSFGLISVNSAIAMERGSIRTGNGGAGGSPSHGAAGQTGGAGGLQGTNSISDRQPSDGTGGKGGTGGHGGRGGAGGGGPSIAVLVLGGRPDLKAIIYEMGVGGRGGDGLTLEGKTDPAGADGLSREIHVIAVQ